MAKFNKEKNCIEIEAADKIFPSYITVQDAIDRIQEHITELYANPNFVEDGTCNIVNALEDFAIPALKGWLVDEPD